MKNKYSGFDISVIEAKIPEDILLRAEEVVDNGQVSGLQPKSKNEWEAIVIDKNIHFSVLIEIKGSKLNLSHCNCKSFKIDHFCEHVLCTIFELRKKIQKSKESKKTGAKKTNKPRQLNVSNLLDSISHEELSAFVLSKARSDRSFKLLLQARFIEKIPQDQLVSFLEATFPILTKANEKIAATKLKVFLDISEELTQHFKNLVSNEELTEAYNLAYLHLKKTFYIKHNLNKDHSRFYKLHKELLSNYTEVYKLIEAPEYRQDIHVQLEELLSTSYISASIKEEKDLWMLHYRKKEYRGTLSSIVKSFLDRSTSDDYNSQYFIKMLSLILKEDKEERVNIIKEMDLQESYRIIQFLNGYSHIEACQECLYSFFVAKQLNHPLSKLIIGALKINKGSVDDIINRTAYYYVLYKDEIYSSFIKEISSSWSKSKRLITDLIVEKQDTSLLVKFHLENEEYKKAIKVLKQNLSWKLLKTFDTKLVEHAPEEGLELYAQLLDEYLKDHFGLIAHEYVREVFNRVTMIGQKQWLLDLKQRLIKTYPERRSIFK